MQAAETDKTTRGTEPDQLPESTQQYAQREADWRNGPVVYQVLVDRFAPSSRLAEKMANYAAPRRLRDWSEKPKRGEFLSEVGVWSHELDFWGGDLDSLRERLDYIAGLHADVLYLNPIHEAFTNHKYDALDYFKVSPEYGTREDVTELADALHDRKMRLVLDGVFNHMGRRSPWFQQAIANEDDPRRDWFFIGPQYLEGYLTWYDAPNLPELRLENPKVRARIYEDKDSVVQGYLRDGVDGWRLDVAYDLGYDILADLTNAAHEAKPGSLVLGEVWNYPDRWMPSMDAILNVHAGRIAMETASGRLRGITAGRMIERMVDDTGIEPLLKCWLVLDNHDTSRLASVAPDGETRRLAQILQFTLPGGVCLYYGTELGLEGEGDPAQRAPMAWDRVDNEVPELTWYRKLLAMRSQSRALRIGDFRLLETESVLAFQRHTGRAADTRIVVLNAEPKEKRELIQVRDASLMNGTVLEDCLSDFSTRIDRGLLDVVVPPQTAWVLRPVTDDGMEYSAYKRIP